MLARGWSWSPGNLNVPVAPILMGRRIGSLCSSEAAKKDGAGQPGMAGHGCSRSTWSRWSRLGAAPARLARRRSAARPRSARRLGAEQRQAARSGAEFAHSQSILLYRGKGREGQGGGGVARRGAARRRIAAASRVAMAPRRGLAGLAAQAPSRGRYPHASSCQQAPEQAQLHLRVLPPGRATPGNGQGRAGPRRSR